jgi:hypothetical protein
MQFEQLTKAIQDQIISLWILGHLREHIENLFHISHGTIHNIVSQYTQADPLVPLLRQIGVAIKSAGLKVDEYAINLRIIQAVARLGCSTHWIETFLARIENEYLSTNRPIEELVTTIAEISEFLAMRNLSVQKALNFLKELMEKIMRLESETNLAEEKRLQSDKLLQDTLSKNQVSMEKVDAFVSHEARLKEMGLTTTDHSKMYNVLVKFRVRI